MTRTETCHATIAVVLLLALAGCGSTTESSAAPAIHSFTATPSAIRSGSSSLLAWSVSGAEALSIDQGIGNVTGASLQVAPAATTTYRLSAQGGGKTVTASVTVFVEGPAVASFTATPATIAPGGSSLLAWSVSGAEAVSIEPGIGVVAGTSIPVTPTATTTYTLTATGAGGSATRQLTVTVLAEEAPRIASFTAAPVTVVPGGSTLLAWSCYGADSVSIDQGIGAVTGHSRAVSPARTTTYTITATRAGRSATASVTIVVMDAPTIAAFTANPAAVASGGSSQLTWSVVGADTVSIDQGVGAVTGRTSTQVTPLTTTTYTLHARNAAGSATARVTVALQQPSDWPTIHSFTATPSTVSAGGAAILSWEVTGASTLSLDHGIGTVSGSSRVVSPAVTTTYTLTATNARGSVGASVVVTVTPADVDVIDDFSADDRFNYAVDGRCTLADWAIAGGALLGPTACSGASRLWRVAPAYEMQDGYVEVRFVVPSSSTDREINVYGRRVGDTAAYVVLNLDFQSGSLQLAEYTTGGWKLLASTASSFATGVAYTMRLVFSDATASGVVWPEGGPGVTVGPVALAWVTSGQAGVGSNLRSGSGATVFDDFVVAGEPAPGPVIPLDSILIGGGAGIATTIPSPVAFHVAYTPANASDKSLAWRVCTAQPTACSPDPTGHCRTCTATTALGSITSAGVYTPPATVASSPTRVYVLACQGQICDWSFADVYR
jgi:hypothetical protein